MTPLMRRRLETFCANRRGFWSLWIFLVLFVVSLFAEFIANDKPTLVKYFVDKCPDFVSATSLPELTRKMAEVTNDGALDPELLPEQISTPAGPPSLWWVAMFK